MSAPLGALADFLEEPLPQQVPGSFMVRPALTLNEESEAPASRLANWRRGVAERFAMLRQRRQENKQRIVSNKDSDLGAPLQSEVDALKGELEELRNEMRMMKVQLKGDKGSDGSSGDESIETATSDPSVLSLPKRALHATDSDERGTRISDISDSSPRDRLKHYTTQSGFGDDQFSGW